MRLGSFNIHGVWSNLIKKIFTKKNVFVIAIDVLAIFPNLAVSEASKYIYVYLSIFMRYIYTRQQYVNCCQFIVLEKTNSLHIIHYFQTRYDIALLLHIKYATHVISWIVLWRQAQQKIQQGCVSIFYGLREWIFTRRLNIHLTISLLSLYRMLLNGIRAWSKLPPLPSMHQ